MTLTWVKHVAVNTCGIWTLHFFDRFIKVAVTGIEKVKLPPVDEVDIEALRTLLINRYLK